MSIRVIIADDDPLIREGLEIVLSRDSEITVVGAVSNGQEAVEFCLSGKIDVAVLDIRMPIMNGVDAAKKITEASDTKVIMLTTFTEDDLISQAIENGAKGYILKGKSTNEILNTIKMVHLGNTVFQESVFKRIKKTGERTALDLSECSKREIEIIKLISEGLSNKEISETIFLSEGTVKNYISSILTKLNLKQRTQIAVYYLKSQG